MIEIPRFSSSQLNDISHYFGQEGVPFDYKGVTTSVSKFGGKTEFFLLVEEEHFGHAVELLMNYFGIAPELSTFEGVCPACNTEIKGPAECPDCGLSLSIGIPSQTKEHPFYSFLDENGLLPKAE